MGLAAVILAPYSHPFSATQPGSPCPAGKWRSFTGNETGVLLAHWLLTCWQRQHEGADPGRVAMLASTVSSGMLAVVAKVVPLCCHCCHHCVQCTTVCGAAWASCALPCTQPVLVWQH